MIIKNAVWSFLIKQVCRHIGIAAIGVYAGEKSLNRLPTIEWQKYHRIA